MCQAVPVTQPLLSDDVLAAELEGVVEQELARHLSTARDWYPHEYVPWGEGRDFEGPLGGEAWTPEEKRFSDAARTSLIINLLTEDNLPSYHTEIALNVGTEGAWAAWLGRWTAEEARHGAAIRDYLLTTRSVDPRALEDARMLHMQEGFTALNPGLLAGVTYVSFQELATRVSHRRTGEATGDPIAEQLLARIALDENLHMLFYRNVIEAAFEIAPDQTMQAVLGSVRDFAMPGHGIEGFGRMAVQIAVEGIYDLRLHRDDVLMPVLRKWRVFERDDFGPAGEEARAELEAFLTGLDDQARRFEEKRDALKARMAARD
ncbi:MAG TPA: acyl-ACP desaturase [Actinobacteria bacterium]|jgi:acyl-[acyl-carrier-protein] desaturase|nr:acyl-ACP desaturase [Actinomycetota bacterium]